MYYSKNAPQSINVPKNYSGNTFRVIDESERHYIKEDRFEEDEKSDNFSTKIDEKEAKKDVKNSIFPSIFSDISVEDVLLLGIMLVIHQENPNDSTLLLLLILLLAK